MQKDTHKKKYQGTSEKKKKKSGIKQFCSRNPLKKKNKCRVYWLNNFSGFGVERKKKERKTG